MIRFLLRPKAGMMLLSAILLTSNPAWAQERQPYTLEQIEGLLEARLATSVILGMVRTDCLTFQIDEEAVERLTAAGASRELIAALRDVCYEGPEPEIEPAVEATPATSPPTTGLFSPASAALRSLAIPGLGQFYTGRPALGAAFLGAWAGAIGFGLMSEKVTVECLAQATDECPSGQVRAKISERPQLMLGLGIAAAVAVISALEARSGAAKVNARQTAMARRILESDLVLEVLPRPRSASAPGMILLQLRRR